MADLSHGYGSRGTAAAQQRDVGWLRGVLEVVEKGVQAFRFQTLWAASHARNYITPTANRWRYFLIGVLVKELTWESSTVV